MGNRYVKTMIMCQGDKFGRLTFVKELEKRWRVRRWLFICDCGKSKEAWMSDVNTWHTNSCGCFQLDRLRDVQVSHGMNNTKIYRVYRGILQRCRNSNDKNYARYGWRGINCDRDSFQDFYADMWVTYVEWLTIDRIDNNWSYCKENCRRADMVTQSNNRSSSRRHKWRTMKERCKILGLKYYTVKWRFYSKKMSFEEAVYYDKRYVERKTKT